MLNIFSISFNPSFPYVPERMNDKGTKPSVTDFSDTRTELTTVCTVMLASTQHPVRYLVMGCLDLTAESKENQCSPFGAGEQSVQSLHIFEYKPEEKGCGKGNHRW